jgi:hypothetical protein
MREALKGGIDFGNVMIFYITKNQFGQAQTLNFSRFRPATGHGLSQTAWAKTEKPRLLAQTGFKVEMQGFEPWSRQGNQRAFYVRIQT